MPLEFSDVTVVPFTHLLGGKAAHKGGPIWPDWDAQVEARHCRGGKPIDTRPESPADPGEMRRIEAAQWCGPIHAHFGHMIADFGMRILPSRLNGETAPLLFSGVPVARYQERKPAFRATPPGFNDMLIYAGVRPRRVLIDTEGLRVGTLFVEPQAEQLGQIGPSAAHLDRLDAWAREQLGPARRDPRPTFFSRAGVFGRFAGEAWLETHLARAGMRVIRPETLPLAEQLEVYHGCAVALFSEGSAMHVPQLLGRAFDRIAVLNRRPGARLNSASLAPRAGEISYHEVVRDLLVLSLPDGRPFPHAAMTLLDPDRLFDTLAELGDAIGLTLTEGWDLAAFRAAEEDDIAAWLTEARTTPLWQAPASVAGLSEVLDRHFPGRFRLEQG